MNQQEAERRAQQLAEHFQDYDDIKFYLKCIYRLSEGQIQLLLEKSGKADVPMYYFKSSAARMWKNEPAA